MTRLGCLFLITVSCTGWIANADDTNVVFRSDVSLFRVDAQVVDHGTRAITGLRADDFILRDEGKVQQIRNFGSEDMPLDVLFLLDVSASMRPHVERIADAAHEALRVLGDDDRFAIVVFDRMARVRMPFRKGRSNLEREFSALLRQETFHGGTDITTGMLYAARYIAKEGRRDARRAIVILTDDETQTTRDDASVLLALERADAVMSALIAPDAMSTHGGYGRRGPRNGGGTWPGAGGQGGGGPLGGVIFGPRGGGGYPRGGGIGGPSTHSAGTSEIARGSGGDSMSVNDASALEDTLSRLRQRYTLHFYLPGDVRSGQQRNLDIRLTSEALRRYPDATVRYRHTYVVPDGASPGPTTSAASGVNSDPVVVTRASSESAADAATPMAEGSRLKRRRAVNEDGSPISPEAEAGSPKSTVATAPAEVAQPPATSTPKPPQRGWRRVDESGGPAQPNLEPQPASKDGWPRTKQ